MTVVAEYLPDPAREDTDLYISENDPETQSQTSSVEKPPSNEESPSKDTHTTSESSSIPDDDQKRSTITKKIPLSEFATLQGILAHQVDEGAPCLKCGPDGCPGLELHFWKKVCKNCGCSRGSHKIQRLIEERKDIPKSILLQTADEDEEDYKELTIAAPPSKVSIKGKADTHKLDEYNEEYINRIREFYSSKRHNLNIPEDKKLTQDQLVILQEYINQTQGQEVVSPEVLDHNLHHLAKSDQLTNTDDQERNSSAESSERLPLNFLQTLQLLQLNHGAAQRAQSPHDILPDPAHNAAAMPRDRYSPDSPVNEEDEYSNKDNRNMPTRGTRPRHDDSTIEMIERLTDATRINTTETVIRKNTNYTESYTSDSNSSDEESDRAPPAKPVRRNPGSFDDLTQGDIVDYYTTVSPSGDYPTSKNIKRKGSPGVWVPPALDPTLVKQYLAALPEDKRPVNTLGVQWRIKQLQTQLPRYDHNINYCHEMSSEEQQELFMFVENRKEKAQGQGEVKGFKKKEKKKCAKCGGLLECGVIADKVPGKVWHPGCFVCTTCTEILVDLIYFQFDGQLHCGRHHAELLRPRCHACDELIFGHEFITADGNEFHKEHFCCWECDASLGGTNYVSHKGQPYCQICYEKLFCTRCVSCKEPIGVGVPVYKHGPLRWHGNPTCYACSFCKRSLVNRTFMPTERYVYCSKNCYRCHDSLKKNKGK